MDLDIQKVCEHVAYAQRSQIKVVQIILILVFPNYSVLGFANISVLLAYFLVHNITENRDAA